MADLSIIIVVSMFLISALVGIIMFFWKESTIEEEIRPASNILLCNVPESESDENIIPICKTASSPASSVSSVSTSKKGAIRPVATLKANVNKIPNVQNFTTPKNEDEKQIFEGILRSITLRQRNNERDAWVYSDAVGGAHHGVVTITSGSKNGPKRMVLTQQQYEELQKQSEGTRKAELEATRKRTQRNIAREAAAAEKRAKSKPSRRSEERRARH